MLAFDKARSEIETVGVESQFDYGITLLVGKVGSLDQSENEHCRVGVIWDMANLPLELIEEALKLYVQIVTWLTKPDNWERKFGEVQELLGKR